MCHYVTAVLPASAPHEDLDAIARAHGRRFEPLANPGVEASIGPHERYFLTTAGHCDCGTPLGALASASRRSPDWAAQEQRLLRKGWSRAKVARSLAQKQEDDLASKALSRETNLKAASSWLDLIGAVLDSGKTPHLGLLLHWYDGALSGSIGRIGREAVRSPELTGELLGHMKEDVLYAALIANAAPFAFHSSAMRL